MIVTEKVSARDLYPSASELFEPARRPARRPTPGHRPPRALLWLLTGILAGVVGRRLLAWIDRNL
ncbi:MAG TPA: hypothetical protein VFW08_03570 [bacterium]|nr:hypothetical protein [bacterium]